MAKSLFQLAGEWLLRASHDLQNARIVGAVPDGPLDTAIYHCQQAAEKALKGWLVAQGATVEKTHDLRRLLGQAAVLAAEFNHLIEATELLTPYASAFRYPGLTDEPMPSRDEFDEALRHAEAVVAFVLSRIPNETHPFKRLDGSKGTDEREPRVKTFGD